MPSGVILMVLLCRYGSIVRQVGMLGYLFCWRIRGV